MDSLVETIDLDIEESNDLAFKIKLEGAASSPAKVRLVCEGNDCAYMFNGYGTGEDDVVQFTLPKMINKLQEGLCQVRVEVLVDNRYFAPLNFQINFKKSLSVVAESIRVVSRQKNDDLRVTASPISTAKISQPAPSKIQFERKPQQNSVASQAPTKTHLRETFNKKQQGDAVDEYVKSLREKFKK